MKLDVPVIGILRGVDYDFFGPLMDAAIDAGLQAIEVTFNTHRAEEMIQAHRSRVPAGRMLGMGTIRNLKEAQKAVDAGAMFMVTPNVDVRVIEYAVSRNVPVIAGGYTPTEVYTAWSAGAAMVKVFPCGSAGPQYIRELRGPFDQIPMVAVGGVRKETACAFLDAGATAVGVGGTLFGKAALQQQSPEAIYANVKDFLKVLNQE